MKLTDQQKFELLQVTSGYYLCTPFPDDWLELDEVERTEFLRGHAWGPLEDEDTETVLDYITTAAYATIRWIERVLPTQTQPTDEGYDPGPFYCIDGYWLDNGETFEGYVVCDLDELPAGANDDEIFFQGLPMQQAARLLGRKDVHEFVITGVYGRSQVALKGAKWKCTSDGCATSTGRVNDSYCRRCREKMRQRREKGESDASDI